MSQHAFTWTFRENSPQEKHWSKRRENVQSHARVNQSFINSIRHVFPRRARYARQNGEVARTAVVTGTVIELEATPCGLARLHRQAGAKLEAQSDACSFDGDFLANGARINSE